jgi:hypothetical protein
LGIDIPQQGPLLQRQISSGRHQQLVMPVAWSVLLVLVLLLVLLVLVLLVLVLVLVLLVLVLALAAECALAAQRGARLGLHCRRQAVQTLSPDHQP